MAITQEEGQDLIKAFCKDYKSALGVTYLVRNQQEEIFGEKTTVESVGKIYGAYFPSRKLAAFATSNFRDKDEFNGTIRHEILGHFGINTLQPREKIGLLNKLVDSKEQPGIKELWDKVESVYNDKPALLKAEEVYSFACEDISPTALVDLSSCEASLKKCLTSDSPMSLRDLRNVTNLVASGMRDGTRTQQIFPATDDEQFKRETTMENKKPFHEVVAEKLIEQLKSNTAPWQRPWEPGEARQFLPYNPTTGNRYKGINAIHLLSQNHDDQRWMTYNQAKDIGAQVRKGEKGTLVQYWKFNEEQTKLDDNGKPVIGEDGKPEKVNVQLERPRCFMATVFNGSQIDGLPPVEIVQPIERWKAHERAENILQSSEAKIFHDQYDRAYYSSLKDEIHLPDKSQFPSHDRYYATALHELGHWTGHDSRLDRKLGNTFGSEDYAKEELRAEISSMILGQELGIGHDPEQHVAYVQSWIKVLQDDPLEIFRAAADAEKIQDYVLSLENQQTLSNEQKETVSYLVAYGEDKHNNTASVDENAYYAKVRNSEGKEEVFYMSERNLNSWIADFEQKGNIKLDAGLNSDINLVLQDKNLTFDHFVSFNGKPLEDVLRENGLTSISSITGTNPNNFYETAHEKLSKIFDIPADYDKTDNAYLERKGLVQAFSNEAESLYQTIQEQENLSMATPPAIEPTIEENDEPRLWQLANDPDEYGEKAGWWVVVSADEEVELSRPIPTEEAAETERQRITAQQRFAKGFKEKNFDDWLDSDANTAFGFEVPHDWNGNVQFRGNIVEEDNGEHFVIPASERGVEPQFYSLYAQLNDGTHVLLEDYNNFDEALTVKENLETAAAELEENELEKAAKLARIHEERVRRDSTSTDDEISAAKEFRKGAEMNAMLNNTELQTEILATEKALSESKAQSVPGEPKEVAYIKVPYAEKEEAKALGAKWDRKEQSWFVPPGLDPEPFSKWVSQAQQIAPSESLVKSEGLASKPEVELKTASERVYLAVPYTERDEAKKLGAKWDTKAKSWFTDSTNDNNEKLKKWLPENVSNEQSPAKSVNEEFADALRSLGCVVPPGSEHPIMDGKKHRIETEGDKLGQKAGFYVGHTDGHPAGFIQNNKTGQNLKWKSKGYTLSEEEKAKLAAEAANKLAAREAEQKQTHLETADRLQKQLSGLSQLVEPTPYLENKSCSVNAGVFTDESKKTTFIPAYDADGKVWTVQYINEDGTKRFAKDSKKEGCFHVVGGMDKLADAPAIVIGEGYATADSAGKVLGFATVAAFDSGNLLAVGKALAEKYPDKPIIFVGDDDRHLSLTQGINAGRDKAEEAARELNGKAVFPIFSPGEQNYPENLPQITPELYKKHLATVEAGKGIESGTVLDSSQLAALSKIKGFTDFNDLENKSELGPEAIKRQLKPIVEKTIKEHQAQSKKQSATLKATQEINREDKKQRSMKMS